MDDDRLDEALTELARNDPDAATIAAELVRWMSGEQGIDAITLSDVQRFAWFELSVKWDTGDLSRADVLAAGASLFDVLHLDRYAMIVRSPQTLDILAAHERSYDEGLKAFQSAYAASAISPPVSRTSCGATSWGLRRSGSTESPQCPRQESNTPGSRKPLKRRRMRSNVMPDRSILDAPAMVDLASQLNSTIITTDAGLASAEPAAELVTS